jgi:hypothetical protein
MLAQKYCQKVNLRSYKEFQLIRERFLGDLENSLRSLPSIIDVIDDKVNFQDRLEALCALLKEKYEFEGRFVLSHDCFDLTNELSDEMTEDELRVEHEKFAAKMVKEHGIVYDWIICCRYNRYGGFSGISNFKTIEQILSFWTQRDFTGSFSKYESISEYNEVEINVRKLPQISVSRQSVQDWTL